MSISQGNIENLRKAFDFFDADKNGKIDKSELEAVLKEANIAYTQQQLETFMSRIDLDGNGSIDYDEFCKMMNEIILVTRAKLDKIKTLFDTIDDDKNGKIDELELQKALSDITGDQVDLEETRTVIRAVDRDNDGHINFQEFVVMIEILQICDE